MPNVPLCRVAAAQLIGTSHLKSHQPCQDYASGRRRGNVAAVALADGAGSRGLSDIGARESVKSTLRHMLGRFDELYDMIADDPTQSAAALLASIKGSLEIEASRHRQPVQQFASTLLFAAVSGNKFVAGHLGDGAIVIQDHDESLAVLSPPENGEYANTTFFTTDPSAIERLRLYSGSMEKGGFVLMSDGSAEALYGRETQAPAPAVLQLLQWQRRLPRKQFESVLVNNLEGPLRRSADDLSLALLSFA